jgi:hypothetical protein
MKLFLKLTTIILLFFAGVCFPVKADNPKKDVVIVINYGKERAPKQFSMEWSNNLTALDALQSVIPVETHPVGKYIIVTSIDGVKGERGVMAWYYTINGKSVGKVAYSQLVSVGDTIQWNYTKDVCSGKVDCVKK